MFLVPFAAAALAQQTWSDEAQGVLVPAAGTVTENGIGSPSVVWDPNIARYVMFFETKKTGGAPAACPSGLWGIGVAASDDGIDWDVWPSLVVDPDGVAAVPWRCVAAHPTVVLDGSTYHLWFKAEQGTGAAQPWGTTNYSGIGHAELTLALDDKSGEIAAVQADLDATEALRDDGLDAFLAAMDDYEADLDANKAELDFCAVGAVPGVCGPCASATVFAPEGTADSQDFCQPFQFAIPATVSVSSNATNHVATLSFTPTGGVPVTCEYRKNAGLYKLDRTNGGAVDARCLNGMTAGTLVTTGAPVTIAINTGPGNPSAAVTLTATNYATATLTGSLLDTFDATEADVAAGDVDATLLDLPGFEADLQALVDWFAPFTPADLEKTQLETDGQALVDQAAELEADLPAWQATLDALADDLAALEAYVQSVVVSRLPIGVAYKINKTFGYPAAMKKGASWVLMYQDYPDIRALRGNSPDGPFTPDATPTVSHGTVSWAQTEVFDPNLLCNGDPVVKYQMYFGGRTLTAGLLTDGGISDAVSFDAVTWLSNIAAIRYFSWTNIDQYRHFDVVKAIDGAGAAQYRMWYTSRVGGKNQVNLASTTLAYPDASTLSRVCL